MSDSIETAPPADAEPLFQLDLKENGGLLAPTSLQEFLDWLQVEHLSWLWLAQIGFGSYGQRLNEGYSALGQSLNDARQAMQYWGPNNQHARGLVENARARASDAFVSKGLPQSDTPLARRIHAFALKHGAHAASHFAAVMTEPKGSVGTFQPQSFTAWHGAIEGVLERFRLPASGADARDVAAEGAFEALRLRAETLVGEKTVVYGALHRQFEDLTGQIGATSEAQRLDFNTAQADRQTEFERLTSEHTKAIVALQKTFREEMALRAPAEYWRRKQSGHRTWATLSGVLSFAGIAGAATWLGLQIHDVLETTKAGELPATWRIALLAMIGVFSVWALRLLVRMFLSHLHLLSDAGERVVMVQTYLSLLESEQAVTKEDRHLILQALFRPASDGIVKDEGVPLSIAELLTKTGK